MARPVLHFSWCQRPPLQLGRYLPAIQYSEVECPSCRMVSYFPARLRIAYDHIGFAPLFTVRSVWQDTPLGILDAVLAASPGLPTTIREFMDDLEHILYEDVTMGVITCPAQLLAACDGLPFLLDFAVVCWPLSLHQETAKVSAVSS